MTITSESTSSWSPLVKQIAAGSTAAVVELYESLKSIRLFLLRQIGPDRAEDVYHDLMIDLVGAIKKGSLREPEALPAYAMAMARRKVYNHIREATRERRNQCADTVVLACAASESPEHIALRSEREAIAKRVLLALPACQREALIRFYLNGEPEEEIRSTMGMSYNQFRLLKSRAKTKYSELVQKSMNRIPCRKAVVPTSLGPHLPQAVA